MREHKWLHLFTSNIRELYIADAIDLLAVPEGFVYQFRYSETHVQDDLRNRWHVGPGGLRGQRLIVYYSLQHAANFHRAAYVPLRVGEVVDAFVEGKTHVVMFKVGGYASLREPTGQETRDKLVHEFSEALRTELEPWYPDYPDDKDKRRSASFKNLPEGVIVLDGNAGSRFESVVGYMTAALEPDTRLFFRVASIWRSKRNSNIEVGTDGYLQLTAGNSYVVEVAHFQTASRDNATLQVDALDGVELLTPRELPLRSRYDVLPIRIFAPFRDDEVQGYLTLSIKEPARGASVRIPVRIVPSITHSVGSPFVAVTGALLAVIPAASGTDLSGETKVCLAIAGGVLLGFSAVGRRSKGLSPYR